MYRSAIATVRGNINYLGTVAACQYIRRRNIADQGYFILCQLPELGQRDVEPHIEQVDAHFRQERRGYPATAHRYAGISPRRAGRTAP